MPKLVAIREHRYGGKLQKPGDTFEATPKHALLLKAVKKAADAPDEVAPAPVQTRAMAPDMAMPEEPEAPRATRRGRYARRDLRAEDNDAPHERVGKNHPQTDM